MAIDHRDSVGGADYSAETPTTVDSAARVLILANNVWNIANFRIELVHQLIRSGYSVICAADPEDLWPDQSAAEKIRLTGARFESISVARKGTNPFVDILTLARIGVLIRRERPDLVLCYTLKPIVYGILAASLNRTRAVAVITGLGSAITRPESAVGRISRRLLQIALNRATAVLVMNESDRTTLADMGIVERDRVTVLPGEGVDTTRFQPTKHDENDEAPVFLFVGRLLRDKGVFEYVEAATQVRTTCPDARFLIGGGLDSGNPTSAARADLEDWVEEGVIEYLGTTDDPSKWYQHADVVVVPSYREGLNRVLLEALASGLPAVASDVPGCRELVEDGVNGYLCQPQDPVSLASAMMRVAELRVEERRQMGIRGRDLVRRDFDLQKVLAYYRNAVPLWLGGECRTELQPALDDGADPSYGRNTQ